MSKTQFEINEQPLHERFINAREQKKLTLDSVSESLSLSITQLKKLESDGLDLDDITAFERGYIRNYAQFLGVDIRQFTDSFPEGDRVSSELKSINRFKYPGYQQPFFKKRVGKIVLVLFVLLVIAGLFTVIF